MKDLRQQLRFISVLMIMLLMAISCKPKTDKLTKEESPSQTSEFTPTNVAVAKYPEKEKTILPEPKKTTKELEMPELDEKSYFINANIKAGHNPYRSSDTHLRKGGSLWFYNLNINDSFEQVKAKMAKFGVTEFAPITNILPQELINLGDCQAYIPHYNVYKKDLMNDFYIVLHKGKIIRFVKYQVSISESLWEIPTSEELKANVNIDFGYTVRSYYKGLLRYRMEREMSSGLKTVIITQTDYAKYFERADAISNNIFRMNDLYFWDLKTNDSIGVAHDKLKKVPPNSFEIKFSSNTSNERILLFRKMPTPDEYYILFQYFKRKYRNYDLGGQGKIQCGIIRERYFYGINVECDKNQNGQFFYFDTSKINAKRDYSIDIPWGMYTNDKTERNSYLSTEKSLSEAGSLWFYNLNINDSAEQIKTKMAEFGVTDLQSGSSAELTPYELKALDNCTTYIPCYEVVSKDLTNDFYVVLHEGKIIRFIKYQLSVKETVPINSKAEHEWLENNSGYVYQEQNKNGLIYRVEKTPTGIQTVIITREDYLQYFERTDKISDTIFIDNDLYFLGINTDDTISTARERLCKENCTEYIDNGKLLLRAKDLDIGDIKIDFEENGQGRICLLSVIMSVCNQTDQQYIVYQYFKRKHKNYSLDKLNVTTQSGFIRGNYFYGILIGNGHSIDFYYFDISNQSSRRSLDDYEFCHWENFPKGMYN